MCLNNTLDEHMRSQKMSVSDLSRKAKISRTTITDIIKGRKANVTLNTAKNLSNCLGCGIPDLFPDLKSSASC
jgi:DNA-binding Xre family transcriptional regulator